jgi:hypothetical protein
MNPLDHIRAAPASIIAVLIGLVRPIGVVTGNKDPEGYGDDVGGFAIRQPSPIATLLPASHNASANFYDLLVSSYASQGMPVSGVQSVTTPAMDGAGKDSAY